MKNVVSYGSTPGLLVIDQLHIDQPVVVEKELIIELYVAVADRAVLLPRLINRSMEKVGDFVLQASENIGRCLQRSRLWLHQLHVFYVPLSIQLNVVV